MAEYIEKQHLLDFLNACIEEEKGTRHQVIVEAIKMTIERMPSADVVERKKGEWMATKFSFKLEHQSERHTYYTCSVCNASYECENADYDFSFCPNCGADMRGGDAE